MHDVVTCFLHTLAWIVLCRGMIYLYISICHHLLARHDALTTNNCQMSSDSRVMMLMMM
jgi:hypothetical protein